MSPCPPASGPQGRDRCCALRPEVFPTRGRRLAFPGPGLVVLTLSRPAGTSLQDPTEPGPPQAGGRAAGGPSGCSPGVFVAKAARCCETLVSRPSSVSDSWWDPRGSRTLGCVLVCEVGAALDPQVVVGVGGGGCQSQGPVWATEQRRCHCHPCSLAASAASTAPTVVW